MDKHLARRIGSLSILTALMTISIGHARALADLPGEHPAYLHARSDLRKADLLARNEYNVRWDMQQVDNEIDSAIAEIDRAAVVDRKDINDHPSVDVSLKGAGRLHEVLRLLRGAQQDLSSTENNYRDLGWRNRAKYHVNQAISFTEKAIRDNT